ncbi:collagenase [Lysobacter sp. BMK333-48F3]|uniref:collagenase n=1 Tax=Lysobacter sp. BMK333-48F3 TaxID=2867962 RepID=UPI001C8BBE1F|nr:collagenase [Lysobacter sp. BMK333-48F3]MBX9401339.1 collagenase [Lysobacter sp. BMK333-48F3]
MSYAPKPRPTHALLIGLAVAAVSLLSFALPWQAAPAPSSPQLAGAPVSTLASARAPALRSPGRKSPSTERQIYGEHRQPLALDPARRAPQQPQLLQPDDGAYDLADHGRDLLQRPSLQASAKRLAKAACDPNGFAALSGNALVAAVKAADSDCINALFGLSGSVAYGTFREAQMITIANALTASAQRYDGTNADSTLQLVLFLRAGYYVQYYDSSVGSYGAALQAAIRPALDAFAGNAQFGRVDDVHGETLAEYVTLIDSAIENARYLYVVKRLLAAYDSSYNAHYWMKVAVNNAYNVTFRGHQDPAFRAAVQADSSIVESLYGFADRHFARLSQPEAYLVANAGRELGRFLQYDGSLKTLVRARVKALLDRSAVTGPTARLWVGVGEMADYYDRGNCSYFGLCDFKARVEAAALPLRHTCSSTLRIRAQAMSATEFGETCSIVAGQENYFHQALGTNRTPVANDQNAALEMVVFDSSDDYGIYAGAIFGIDTNNGGMYLEGNPAQAGNQARFIAHEADWVLPRFEIWNLTHEYVHYLDGRFDMHGDFNAAMSQKTVWWVEGLAEYMSFSYRNLANTAAQQEAARATYALSRVYGNDYNSGQNLVYRWGYLAVRFMFEKRREQVNAILGYFRPGNYTGYAGYMGSIGSGNDAAFRAWLPCVAEPDGAGCGGTPNQAPTASFTALASGLGVRFSDGSADPDGRVVAWQWSFGDGSGSTEQHPSKTYAAAGSYTVTLTVTDDRGATAKAVRTVAVAEPGLPECAGADTRQLDRNCARSNVAATAGNYAYFYLYVPAGTPQLRIEVAGGSGNADLYVNTNGSWATRSAHNYRSTQAGNAETLTVPNPPAGYVYVSLYAASGFSGARIGVRY